MEEKKKQNQDALEYFGFTKEELDKYEKIITKKDNKVKKQYKGKNKENILQK